MNSICYYYPGILKHEIEYLHYKIHDLKEKAEQLEESADITSNRYEREFSVGKGDYQPKYKIIVLDGKIYLQCIDKFEDIFELSKEVVQHMELTDILDPYMFDNHK